MPLISELWFLGYIVICINSFYNVLDKCIALKIDQTKDIIV